MRLDAAKLPGEQAVGGAAPPGQREPAGHAKHSGDPSSAVTSANVPGPHAAGSSSDAPIGQKLPRPHASQWVAPTLCWKEPGGHSSHAAAPSLAAKLPAAHGHGAVLAAAHACPAEQGLHSAARDRSVAFEKLPAPQTSGADAPSGQ